MPRTLSERELNRALLARQGLLERFSDGVPRTLERIGGIQAQYAPSMYVGLWSRMGDLARADLTAALEQRRAVQATLMRVTIHLVSRRDYWAFALATRRARRTLWLRAVRGAASDDEMREAAALVRERLTASEVLHRKEIEELVGKVRGGGVGLWIDLVRVPPSGTWERRRADLYAAAEDWLGPPALSEDEAAETSRAPRFRIPRRPPRCATCRPGTRRSSSTPAGPGCSARSTARGSSTSRTPIRRRCSSSTEPSPGRGATATGASSSTRSPGSTPRHGARSPRRASGWPRFTAERR